MAGKTTIPAIVTDLNDKDSAEVALIENVQRQNLTPIEEAISYKKILDMGYLTQEALADKLGKTQSTIANKLRLLNLSDEVQEALLNEKISERHARSLLKLNDQNKQNTMLERIITERLTVRKTDEEIKNMLNNNENEEIIGFETPQEPTQPVNVNIPTSSIVEDNSAYDPTPVADIAPMPNIDVTNPGFVDVDKIENQAKDINVEKALNDIDALLKPSDILVSEPEIVPTVTPNANIFSNPSLNEVVTPVTPVVEPTLDENNEDDDAESILKPGKFFNIMEDESENKEEEQTPIVPEPTIEVQPEPVVMEPVVPTIEEPQEVPETIDFSQFFTAKDPEPISFGSEEQTPIVPEPTVEEKTEPVVMEPVVSTVEEPQETSMPSLNPSFVDTPIDFNRPMPTYEPIYDLDDDEPVLPEPMKVEPNEPTGNSFRDVIKILRDSEQKIEQAGFVLEMEEFDFDDMYQVIFKIKK